jgi:hypothetical protein
MQRSRKGRCRGAEKEDAEERIRRVKQGKEHLDNDTEKQSRRIYRVAEDEGIEKRRIRIYRVAC